MLPRGGDPLADGPGVEGKGGDNGGFGTAVGDQGHDLGNQGRGILLAIEGRARAGRERPTAEGTAVPLLALAMDSNVAPTHVSPCRTGRIGAKLGVRIHGKPPEL
jgi:hypothetical protein